MDDGRTLPLLVINHATTLSRALPTASGEGLSALTGVCDFHAASSKKGWTVGRLLADQYLGPIISTLASRSGQDVRLFIPRLIVFPWCPITG